MSPVRSAALLAFVLGRCCMKAISSSRVDSFGHHHLELGAGGSGKQTGSAGSGKQIQSQPGLRKQGVAACCLSALFSKVEIRVHGGEGDFRDDGMRNRSSGGQDSSIGGARRSKRGREARFVLGIQIEAAGQGGLESSGHCFSRPGLATIAPTS